MNIKSLASAIDSRYWMNQSETSIHVKKGKLLEHIGGLEAEYDPSVLFEERSDAKHGYYVITQDRIDNGLWVYDTPAETQQVAAAEVVSMSEWKENHVPQYEVDFVPSKIPNFKATKIFRTVRAIMKSRQFFPTYLVGETGCGKTINIIHAAAMEKRELVRLNFTEATSEQHIIGGYRIVDGNTIWVDGPAIVAMKRGALLLLDEIDLGSPKIMCLQSILEGSGYYNERTGEMVRPAEGFQIFATANTKGQLSGASRKYIGARAQNEAFLDRFAMSVECDYMTNREQREVLNAEYNTMLEALGLEETNESKAFLNTSIEWVEKIAKSYKTGSFDFRISTRRARDLIRAYFIMGSVKDAVKGIVARYDEERQTALFRLFNSMHEVEIEFIDRDDDDDDNGENNNA